jgi:hypothetical protein
MRADGIDASCAVDDAVDEATFRARVEQILVPTSKPGE